MRVLTENEVFDLMTNSSIKISESDYIKMLYAVEMYHEIRSDFSGNLFYYDGVCTRPLHIKIPELKNEHDEMAEVEK